VTAAPASSPRPWPPAAATGVGSLPGTDLPAALELVLAELADFPHLPELPARGPGADLVGRGLAHLAEVHAEIGSGGWRLAARPGREERAARDLLERDLDLLTSRLAGTDGPVKLAAAGPWTLAAAVELPRGGPALGDAGAVRDIAAALGEGIGRVLVDLTARLPQAHLVLQLDEPSLPTVLAGQVPTASRFGRVAAPATDVAADLLRQVMEAVRGAAAVPVVHCCGDEPPIGLFGSAGAAGVSIDLSRRVGEDALGAFLEAGGTLFAGVLPAMGPGAPPPVSAVADPVRQLWHRLGFPAQALPPAVVVTPACGLAGASTGWARTAYRLAGRAGRSLADAPDALPGSDRPAAAVRGSGTDAAERPLG
jgi:methionine synthase II (cobalamin-independent)